jgi:hypothetical protein
MRIALYVGVSYNWRSLDSCNTLAGLYAAGGTRTGGVETNIGTNEQRYRCTRFSCQMSNTVQIKWHMEHLNICCFQRPIALGKYPAM